MVCTLIKQERNSRAAESSANSIINISLAAEVAADAETQLQAAGVLDMSSAAALSSSSSSSSSSSTSSSSSLINASATTATEIVAAATAPSSERRPPAAHLNSSSSHYHHLHHHHHQHPFASVASHHLHTVGSKIRLLSILAYNCKRSCKNFILLL